MQDEPNLKFDIDALFDHLVTNLSHELGDEKEWCFNLRSPDFCALEQVAEEFGDEFHVIVQENVEEVDADGNVSLGDPLLVITRRGALTADDVKQIAERVQSIAADRGLTYEGVDCYTPVDEEEMFGWLEPEDAAWRLRNMTDSGLPDDADLPWAFLVGAPSWDSTSSIAAALAALGFEDRDDYDEPDEDGDYGMCVFVEGRNNEFELLEAAKKIAEAAEARGGRLIGIQFYTREDVSEIFGNDEP